MTVISGRAKNFFLIFLVFFAKENAFSFQKNTLQYRTIIRFVNVVTGVLLDGDVVTEKLTCKALAYFYAGTEWAADGSPSRKIDRIFPDFSGIFDAAQQYDSSNDSGLWIYSLGEKTDNPFLVERPKEFEKAQKEIENISKAKNEDSFLKDDFSGGHTSKDDEPLLDGSLLGLQKSKSFSERRLLESDRTLRIHFFEDEVLAVQPATWQKSVVVSNGAGFFRKFYDSEMRLYKKEAWTNGDSLEKINLKSSEEYSYLENESKPFSKTLVADGVMQETFYDGNGRVTEFKDYSRSSEEKNGAEEPYFVLLSRTNFSYTDEGKLKEKRYAEYEYSKSDKKKILNTFEKRDVYDYKTQERPPDYYYYEGERLCLETIYSSKDSWITTMYFDDGFSAKAVWLEGKHVRDDFYLNEKIRRSRSYE